jgi:hypothetical protein
MPEPGHPIPPLVEGASTLISASSQSSRRESLRPAREAQLRPQIQHRHGSRTGKLGRESTRTIGHQFGFPLRRGENRTGPVRPARNHKIPVLVTLLRSAQIRGAPTAAKQRRAPDRLRPLSCPRPSAARPTQRDGVNRPIEPLSAGSPTRCCAQLTGLTEPTRWRQSSCGIRAHGGPLRHRPARKSASVRW